MKTPHRLRHSDIIFLTDYIDYPMTSITHQANEVWLANGLSGSIAREVSGDLGRGSALSHTSVTGPHTQNYRQIRVPTLRRAPGDLSRPKIERSQRWGVAKR
jgi:hypothetical protein